jgi:hypothetical protein
MGRLNRRSRRRTYSGPPATVAEFLSWGGLLLDGDAAPEDPAGEWSAWGEAILEEWAAARPGSRPWAWWAFEAPGPRRQVGPGPRSIGPQLWFGVPRFLEAPPAVGQFETEAEFLRRNKLLLPGEETRSLRSVGGESLAP